MLHSPLVQRLAHSQQLTRPDDSSVLGNEGPELDEAGDLLDGPVGSRAGDGGRHACAPCGVVEGKEEGRLLKSFWQRKKFDCGNFRRFFFCVYRCVVAPECSSEVRERERERGWRDGTCLFINVEEIRGTKGGCAVGDEED